MSVRESFQANTLKSDLPMVNRKWNMTPKFHPTLEPSTYKQLPGVPRVRMFSAEKSVCPRRFIGDGPQRTFAHTPVLHVVTISPGGAFYIHEYIWSHGVRTYTCTHVSKKSADSNQPGSFTLRPPRLLYCCFPMN